MSQGGTGKKDTGPEVAGQTGRLPRTVVSTLHAQACQGRT